jgi:hypothetical protein
VWKLGGSWWKAGATISVEAVFDMGEECDSLGYELAPHATTTYVYPRGLSIIYILATWNLDLLLELITESPRDRGFTGARKDKQF